MNDKTPVKSFDHFRTYRIFLASSLSLKKEREKIETEISGFNNFFGRFHIRIELVLWESLDSGVYLPQKQDQCNEELQTCDVLMLLYWGELGKFSELEYRIAVRLLKEKGYPKILIYKKTIPFIADLLIPLENIDNLKRLEEELAAPGNQQWPTKFDDTNALILKVYKDLVSFFHNELSESFFLEHPLPEKQIRHDNLIRNVTLFGREKDVEKISNYLRDPNIGLITLLGPGGTGKSTLANKAAHDNEQYFPDGSIFVELAPLRDGKLIVDAIAKTLSQDVSVNSLTKSAEDQLIAFLGNKKLIIILDNCEYLVQECQVLAMEIIKKCHNVKIIATTQLAFGITHEKVIHVQTLTKPKKNQALDDELRSNPCIQLFLLHAKNADPKFKLSEKTKDDVIAICNLRAGMPLGIILAASALCLKSISNINKGIEHHLENIGEGHNDFHDHHLTMKKAIEWSYNLLTDEQKYLFIKLSLFRDDFTEEAAAALIDDLPGFESDFYRLILVSILTKSDSKFLKSKTFFILEPLRKYGIDKLRNDPSFQSTCANFIKYYMGMTENFTNDFFSGEQSTQLMMIEEQYNNIVEAMDLIKRTPDWLPVAKMCSNLWRYWEVRAHFKEGITRMEEVLELSKTEPETYLELLHGLGMLYYRGGAFETANALSKFHLQEARNYEDTKFGKMNVAHALINMANGESATDIPLSKKLLAEAYDNVKQFNNKRLMAVLENNQGNLYRNSNDLNDALIFYGKSARSFEEQENLWESGYPLFGLGSVYFQLENFDAARKSFEEAYNRREKAGDKRNMGRCELYLALIHLKYDEISKSLKLMESSSLHLAEINDRASLCELLLAMLQYCVQTGFNQMAVKIHSVLELKYAEQLFRTPYLKKVSFNLIENIKALMPAAQYEEWKLEGNKLKEETVLTEIKNLEKLKLVNA